ncbi:MAG: aspartate/glutamate racemase family protein [Candidatus Thorarchaeota archaeon]
MEILYLIPGDGMPEDELKRREDVTNSIARQGTRVTVEEVGEGPLSIESEIEAYMSVGPFLKWLFVRRKDNKFDAIIIGCAGDPGLRAVRELMDIPVIGPAESAYHIACMVADRFSVISPMQAGGVNTADDLVARTREMGLHSRLASVEFVEMPIVDMWSEDATVVIKQTKKAIDKAKENGAGAIVLGCMSMAFRTAGTKWDAGIPVINPLAAAIKVAESFVDMSIMQSRVTYPAADFDKLVGTVFKE